MRKLIFVLFLLGGYFSGYAQVGIGTRNPSSSALLDIHSAEGNKGVAMPKVALISKQSYAPITGSSSDKHNLGLIMYNTTTDHAKELVPGYYYWTGTSWTALLHTEAIFDLIDQQNTKDGVYYGKINGGTQAVLYVKKKDAQGNQIQEEIDLLRLLLQDVSNLSEEHLYQLRKTLGYDITEHVVYTGKSVRGQYHYSVYGRTAIEDGNAEVQGVRLSRETVQLLEEGVVFDIHLLNAQQQIIDINTTEVEVTNGGLLKFSLGSSSMYYTLPAGEYGVIVDLLSSRELLSSGG